MRTRDEIRTLLQDLVARTGGTEAQASYYTSTCLATRFAENAITHNMAAEGESLRLTVAFGRRRGSAVTNRLDDAALARLVAKAADIARHAPEDPEYVPQPGPQTYPAVPQRWFADAADLTPGAVADGVAAAVALARSRQYIASGLFSHGVHTSALANSGGLFAFDEATHADFSVTMHGPQGSSSAGESGESASAVDPAAIAARALTAAQAAQAPRDIEPGDYTVIFEPEAVSQFAGFLFWNLDARDADEGTTALAGKVGCQLVSDKITVSTEIDDPELPASPYGADGLAAKRTVWIRHGVVERLFHDRFWARQKRTDADPALGPLTMAGEARSLDDLVAACRRGLLVKRLWYIRYVDHRELLLTGMTRDGLFLVENGAVVGPAKNLRFNESPIVFLRNVVALSRPKRVGGMKVPGVLSEGFTFSSKTESV